MQIIGRSLQIISVDRRAIECEHICRNDQNCAGYSFDISCEHYQEIDSIEYSTSSTLSGVKIKYGKNNLCDEKHQLKLCDEMIFCDDGCFLNETLIQNGCKGGCVCETDDQHQIFRRDTQTTIVMPLADQERIRRDQSDEKITITATAVIYPAGHTEASTDPPADQTEAPTESTESPTVAPTESPAHIK